MSWRTHVAVTGLALALALAVPARAEAQSGFWEYIFRLSGPAYGKTITGRVSTCLDTPWCLETAVGPFVLEKEPERKALEPQLGFSFTYGWDGDNEDKLIDDSDMLLLEPHLRLLAHRAPAYLPRVFSAGLGFHRFSGGTVPEEFWRTAFVWSVGWRLQKEDFKQDQEDAGQPDPSEQQDERELEVGWFVEFGLKFRSFFDPLLARDFGGLQNDDETESTGTAFFAGAGLRFEWRR